MTPKGKFKIGQRVRLTQAAIEAGIRVGVKWNTGVVTGGSRLSAAYVVVRPDGNKTAMTFSADFWEPVR